MEILNELGVIFIAALGVLAYQTDEGGQAHLAHQQHIQHPVVGHGIGHRHKAAAVVPPVAHTDDGGGAAIMDRAHLHLHGAADTF